MISKKTERNKFQVGSLSESWRQY